MRPGLTSRTTRATQNTAMNPWSSRQAVSPSAAPAVHHSGPARAKTDHPTATWSRVGTMPMRNTGRASSRAKKTRWLMRTMPVEATPGMRASSTHE